MTPSKHIIHLFFPPLGREMVIVVNISLPSHPRSLRACSVLGVGIRGSSRSRDVLGCPGSVKDILMLPEAVGTTMVASKPTNGKPPPSPSLRRLPPPTLSGGKNQTLPLPSLPPFQMKAPQTPLSICKQLHGKLSRRLS